MAVIHEVWRRTWKARGLWLRILFCWALSAAFVSYDETKDYDLRFRLRGAQEASKDIVLIYLDQNEWSALSGTNPNFMRANKEGTILTDSYFWSSRFWNSMLGKVLAQNPRSVGVTFFFSDQLPRPNDDLLNLNDPRVLWAGQLDNEGRPALPLMANSYGYNVALVDLREDEDRILRRFTVPLAPLPHMGLRLAEKSVGGILPEMSSDWGESRLINFRGAREVFPAVSASAVMQQRVPATFFRDKIVLIGSHSLSSHQFHTPMGPMSRADVLAQILDNSMNKRWIQRLKPGESSIYLVLILSLAALVLTSYPQAIALVFLLWLAAGTTALSLWVFDSFYFWLPAFSPLFLSLVTYIIFLGYQLSQKENQTWRLEQEKSLLSELDQLRNNFVSLISHDLKTPIAKIQAICDRLLSGSVDTEVKDGLQNVRKESVELHRYIQSILQLSRLESSQVQVRKDAVDLNELVEKVMQQLRPLTDDKHQTVDAKLEPMFSIEVDSVMIQEVILNLLENAVKYTPPQGTLEVQTQEVEDKVIFSVRDNGPGISKDDQEHLFEKFFRGQAQKSAVKGTGLGLFLVKYFIELHGGEVFLESEVGKGTRVGFTLPLMT